MTTDTPMVEQCARAMYDAEDTMSGYPIPPPPPDYLYRRDGSRAR